MVWGMAKTMWKPEREPARLLAMASAEASSLLPPKGRNEGLG